MRATATTAAPTITVPMPIAHTLSTARSAASYPASARAAACLGAVIVLAFFCLPLFIGLGGWDLHNDESIYAYSVDRIVETNEWLTPRSIQVDGPFLEKPPLKFWITAGLIKAGVLPHDEKGMRTVDAFFGALAFLYVYAIGFRLAGIVCGIGAVLVLFTMDRFVFDHGLRSYNMDAALVLAYCGGIYHFARWEALRGERRGRWHALAVALYFVLGFLTKFVAVLFLPVVCGVAFLWRRDAWIALRTSWSAWIVPALVIVALSAPWFVYQMAQSGSLVWEVILGEHVYTRFTASLDPNHLHPWHYYFVEAWNELANEGSQWMAAAGVLLLGVTAWDGRSWLARLILTWLAVPFVLLTIGSSKLFHYAYPFLPALALGAGYASALLVRAIADGLEPLLQKFGTSSGMPSAGRRRWATIGAAIAFGVAVWTVVAGNVDWTVGGWRLFRNSSLARPIAIGAAFLWLRGSVRGAALTFGALPLIVLLPVIDYQPTIAREASIRRPLHVLRDCVLEVKRSGAAVGDGVYNAAQRVAYHSYYYYLSRLGTWTEAEHPDPTELHRRMTANGAQTIAIVSLNDYRVDTPAVESDGTLRRAPESATALTVAAEEGILLLLPSAFEPCRENVVAAGGFVVDEAFLRGSRP